MSHFNVVFYVYQIQVLRSLKELQNSRRSLKDKELSESLILFCTFVEDHCNVNVLYHFDSCLFMEVVV